MKSLIIDEGNTFIKISIMSDNGEIEKSCRVKEMSKSTLAKLFSEYKIEEAIYCSVREINIDVCKYLERECNYFIPFTNQTPIPIKNDYTTPQTVGADRLAAAVGASELFHGHNILIIDLGSAITVDFVENGKIFKGGNISPGASLRFKSLNTFTNKLPLCNLNEEKHSLCARSTLSAIESGVVLGIVYEIDGYIKAYEELYDDLKIIFTGGDAKYFGSKFKIPIFANCEIVTKGLYKVLKYNDVDIKQK
ncbi:MAG: type III pantothenate kinase [Rikenellaceae bacterium]